MSTAKKVIWISFDEGLAKANIEKKHMIVDFYTDWCHWCKVMDEKTFNDAKVNKKLKERFITVRINAESRSETATYKGKTFSNVELTQAFGVKGFPSLAFLNPDGDIITIVPGYVPAETLRGHQKRGVHSPTPPRPRAGSGGHASPARPIAQVELHCGSGQVHQPGNRYNAACPQAGPVR